MAGLSVELELVPSADISKVRGRPLASPRKEPPEPLKTYAGPKNEDTAISGLPSLSRSASTGGPSTPVPTVGNRVRSTMAIFTGQPGMNASGFQP